MGAGCNVTRGGTKQLSVFCHMKPPRNICDRNCRPRHHGGLSLCSRQIFILPIWGWYEYEIFLLIISARGLKERKREREKKREGGGGKKRSTRAPVGERVQAARTAPTDVMHVETNVREQKKKILKKQSCECNLWLRTMSQCSLKPVNPAQRRWKNSLRSSFFFHVEAVSTITDSRARAAQRLSAYFITICSLTSYKCGMWWQ